MFQNKKLWEIRNFGTKIRGKIYLIQSGSKQIVGECHIVNCIKLDEETFETNRNIHTIESFSFLDIRLEDNRISKKEVSRYTR